MSAPPVEPPDALRVKIVTLGPAGCGKSCVIKRFCEGKFVTRHIATIGVDFGVKPVKVDATRVKVNFFDLSGQPEHVDIRREFYSDVQGAVLVYDVTRRASFDELSEWLDELHAAGGAPHVTVVVGNKSDRTGRAVSAAEGLAWATERGLDHFETSANTGAGIVELWTAVFERAVAAVQASCPGPKM